MSKFYKTIETTLTVKLSKKVVINFVVIQNYSSFTLTDSDGGIKVDGYITNNGELVCHKVATSLEYFFEELVRPEIIKVLKLKK